MDIQPIKSRLIINKKIIYKLTKYIIDVNSYNDFYSILLSLDSKEKGDLFEEFTKFIFMFHPNYSSFIKKSIYSMKLLLK